MGKPFTPERLERIRRMRKARRLYKKQPLFAFQMMLTDYPDYTHELYMDDLRYRKKPKKRNGRFNPHRFGRYSKIMELLRQYERTGNSDFALRAIQMRAYMTRPYRVLVRVGGEEIEYSFSPRIPVRSIENLLSQFSGCKTEAEVGSIVSEFRRTAHIY